MIEGWPQPIAFGLLADTHAIHPGPHSTFAGVG
jgi:hypothetical protein